MDTTPLNVGGQAAVAAPLQLIRSWNDVDRAPSNSPARTRSMRGQEVLTPGEWIAVAKALRLSPRELQIAQGVFDDLKEAAIAERLGISAHTVHTHLERLYRKVGVSGRGPLIVAIFAEYLRMSGSRFHEAM